MRGRDRIIKPLSGTSVVDAAVGISLVTFLMTRVSLLQPLVLAGVVIFLFNVKRLSSAHKHVLYTWWPFNILSRKSFMQKSLEGSGFLK